MSDEDLVRTSDLIVAGEVLAVEGARAGRRRIVTNVTLRVDEVLKGRVDGSVVVVTEPGGRAGDTLVWIHGAPRFTVGEHVLVFLRRRADGTLRTNALSLGKYEVETVGPGVEQALRRIPSEDRRELPSFLATIDGLVSGDGASEEALTEAPATLAPLEERPATSAFTFLGPPERLPARWFEPDSNAPVRFFVANSDAVLGSARSDDVIRDALAAWTNVASATIVLERAGGVSTAESAAGGVCDDDSKIQFNDPFGEIANLNIRTNGCTGVFAVGGFCATSPAREVGGTLFLQITEGDATINNGAGQCIGRTDMAETVAHEIGHAIGLGHSSERFTESNSTLREALMYAFVHHDGRGAALNTDDIAGLSALYPLVEASDSDGDGVSDLSDRCPSTPAGLLVSSDGCACTEPDSLGCGDGDLCTVDACNETNGACVHTAIDCSDPDPCTIDGCDPLTGACTNDLKGDTDGDGLCDPIDNCPLQPDADPTDSNGDGVGDVCQCADAKPGRCVPGRGVKTRRCVIEWMPAVTPKLAKGTRLPLPRLACTDGDPECDDDDVVGQCTFRVALCISSEDPRIKKCTPPLLENLFVRSPRPLRPGDAADEANASVLSAARTRLLAERQRNRCSAQLPIVVPTRGRKHGAKRLKVSGLTEAGRPSRAKLRLVCKPAVPTSSPQSP